MNKTMLIKKEDSIPYLDLMKVYQQFDFSPYLNELYLQTFYPKIFSNYPLVSQELMKLKEYDIHTYVHSLGVAIITTYIGLNLGIAESELVKLVIGALLHDIGKIFISLEILNQKESLSDEKFNLIKCHPEKGYQYLLTHFQPDEPFLLTVREHHERYDGGGYPLGKKGKEIALFSRIVTLADVYDALVTDRPYRKAISSDEASRYINNNQGTIFDPFLILYIVRFSNKQNWTS